MATINKIPKCPPLRFPDYSNEWTTSTISKVCKVSTGSMNTQDKVDGGDYPFYVRSSTIERTNRYTYDGIAILTPGDGAIGKIFHYSEGKIAVHQRVYILSEITIDAKYLFYYFSDKFYNRVIRMSAKNTVDSVRINMITDMPLSLPSLAEQKKIADFLSLIDERIQSCSETLRELKNQKAALLNQLFSQKLRFPDFNDEWTQTTLGEILDYEQPTLYIVNNTDYSNDSSLIPVLTANKSFVLGYVNEENIYDKGECIILDDFTLDIKFVDFPFKVKSSAIKILTAKKSVNIKTIYNYLLFMNLRGQEKDHKRHYISEIQPLSISLPSLEEQKRIADFLSLIDERIEVEEQLLQQYEKQKRYLLRQMFV